MADECTGVVTIKELSIFCHWIEKGSPVEHFIKILGLKKADAESIYSVLIDWLKMKNVATVSQACSTNSRCLE